jgi:hypothetical protein
VLFGTGRQNQSCTVPLSHFTLMDDAATVLSSTNFAFTIERR